MDPKREAVIKALDALREALNKADANSQQGWMKTLYHAAEAAHTAVTIETALQQQSENAG